MVSLRRLLILLAAAVSLCTLTVTAAPTITAITPNSVSQGTLGLNFEITGSGFEPGLTVKLRQTGYADIVIEGVGLYSSSRASGQLFIWGTTPTGVRDVIVINPNGQSATLARGFTITPGKPTASFTASPAAGPAPLAVQFTDTSSGSPTSWSWSFGDGGTSTLRNPGHTYTAAGTYTVSLTASSQYGQSTKTQTGMITVNSALPTITSITPSTAAAGTTIAITNLAGTGFRSDMTVKLRPAGYGFDLYDIPATSMTVVSPTRITCQFAPKADRAAVYDVLVVTPGVGTVKLGNGFTVTTPVDPWYVPHVLPCTIEAEHYDITGPEVGYSDWSETWIKYDSGYLRWDDVDLSFDPSLNSHFITDIDDLEWTKYTVQSPTSATYPVTLRVSAWTAPGAPKSYTIDVRVDSVTQQTVTVPATYDISTHAEGAPWSTVATQVTIPAGRHSIQLVYRGALYLHGFMCMEVDRMVVGSPVTGVKAVPGGTGAPRDANGDGKYEDVNGNGRPDFADVVLYFNQMSWISGNEPMSAFDYNGNGRIDFSDVVWIFNHL